MLQEIVAGHEASDRFRVERGWNMLPQLLFSQAFGSPNELDRPRSSWEIDRPQVSRDPIPEDQDHIGP